jgi:PAS domain S-box-containing protein
MSLAESAAAIAMQSVGATISPMSVAIVTSIVALGALAWVLYRHDTRATAGRLTALERERGRIRAFIESAGEGLYAIDLDGNCTMANQAAARWLGYSPDEMIGRNMHNLIHHTHPDGTPALDESCTTAKALRGGEEVHISEDVFWRRDGTSFPVEYRSAPILENGRITGAVVSFADVTARVRAAQLERFLDDSGRVLASSIDFDDTLASLSRLAVPIVADCCIIDIVDDDGLLTPTIAHVDAVAADAIREQRRSNPLHREDDHPIVHALRSCASVAVDGATDAGWLAASIPDGNGRKPANAGICIPLVAREYTLGVVTFARIERRFDHEDLTLAHDLARRAAIAIDNARLYRDARAATNARDEMLAIVSHDLRNPLHTIGMSAQLMLEALPDDSPSTPLRKQAGIIRRSAQRANRLIADLLDVRRIETGRLAIECAPVDVRVLVEDVDEMFAAEADERHVALARDVSASCPSVLADRERVLQLFTNLVGNALKFTPAGGTVTVSAEPADGGVRFRVRDTGPGIPAEQLPHLFDRYWQARRNDRRGVGLGLAIAKGIAQAHGSTLTASSEVGKGTEFAFTLPAASAIEPRTLVDEPARRADAPDPLGARRQGPTVDAASEFERT